MRTRQTMQPSFLDLMPSHRMGKELEQISKMLDEMSEVLSLVMADLVSGRRKDTGRSGMTAVVREGILRRAIAADAVHESFPVGGNVNRRERRTSGRKRSDAC